MFFLHRLLSAANSHIRPFRINCRHFETREVNGVSGAALCSYLLLQADFLVTSSSMKCWKDAANSSDLTIREGGVIT